MLTIIPKFSYIPIESKKTLKLKKIIKINLIYEGESENLKDNVQLLNIVIEIPPLPLEQIKLMFIFLMILEQNNSIEEFVAKELSNFNRNLLKE